MICGKEPARTTPSFMWQGVIIFLIFLIFLYRLLSAFAITNLGNKITKQSVGRCILEMQNIADRHTYVINVQRNRKPVALK